MYDLRIVVEEIKGFCDLPMEVGDYFEVHAGRIIVPPGTAKPHALFPRQTAGIQRGERLDPLYQAHLLPGPQRHGHLPHRPHRRRGGRPAGGAGAYAAGAGALHRLQGLRKGLPGGGHPHRTRAGSGLFPQGVPPVRHGPLHERLPHRRPHQRPEDQSHSGGPRQMHRLP